MGIRTAAARGVTIAIAGATACAALSGCTAVTGGDAVASTNRAPLQAPVYDAGTVEQMLLPTNQVNVVMGAAAMALHKTRTDMFRPDSGFADATCMGPWYPAVSSTYASSGWTAVRSSEFTDVTGDSAGADNHVVIEALIAMPSVPATTAFFKDAQRIWAGCANRDFTASGANGRSWNWEFADLQANQTTLTMLQTQEAGGGWACERTLRMSSNIVADTMACGVDVSGKSSALAAAMISNIPDNQ
ncbi:PknH-like protein [Mycobacterium sp. BK086]|uniref:sensor domain-containing protein n=1 Tax=Mycobacterium sp. BK086 TaxID=2512165 RepID=UPI0010F2CD40|nr:sensor domain-containing protein [Mycobacterium sp. BK086]TDO06556.1 PknH-like protein [Mycobacterium sp. BK086]